VPPACCAAISIANKKFASQPQHPIGMTIDESITASHF
jgi:hypothetical protein